MVDPITFNSLDMENDFYSKQVSSLLRRVVLDAAEYSMNTFGWILHGTSLLRSEEEDKALRGSGVHVDGRGFDIRTRGIPKKTVEALAKYVNTRWEYDSSRPRLLVLFVKTHGTGPHGHFQVHPKTRRRPSNAQSLVR
jgi:hypothetical protein